MTSVALISVVFIITCFMIESSVILVHKTCATEQKQMNCTYAYPRFWIILINYIS